MNPLFTLTDTETVIYINRHLKNSRYVLLAIFAIGLMAGYFFFYSGIDTRFFAFLVSPITWLIYLSFFAILFLVSTLNGQKKMVFSAGERAVYSQTALGKKQLMAFIDIGAIKPYSTSYGVTYFALFRKDNLYGRDPIRISPNYTETAKSRRQYDEFAYTVLPQLQAIIGQEKFESSPKQVIINNFNLTYYTQRGGTYWLKHTYHRDQTSLVFIALLLAVSVLILAVPDLRLRYINFAIGAGIGAGVMAFLFTEKKSFQQGDLVSEYINGLLRKTYPLSQFSTFQITHRKHNFIYVGTDVSLLINNKTVFLCQMRKTEQIEHLISETNFIIDQQTSLPASI